MNESFAAGNFKFNDRKPVKFLKKIILSGFVGGSEKN